MEARVNAAPYRAADVAARAHAPCSARRVLVQDGGCGPHAPRSRRRGAELARPGPRSCRVDSRTSFNCHAKVPFVATAVLAVACHPRRRRHAVWRDNWRSPPVAVSNQHPPSCAAMACNRLLEGASPYLSSSHTSPRRWIMSWTTTRDNGAHSSHWKASGGSSRSWNGRLCAKALTWKNRCLVACCAATASRSASLHVAGNPPMWCASMVIAVVPTATGVTAFVSFDAFLAVTIAHKGGTMGRDYTSPPSDLSIHTCPVPAVVMQRGSGNDGVVGVVRLANRGIVW